MLASNKQKQREKINIEEGSLDARREVETFLKVLDTFSFQTSSKTLLDFGCGDGRSVIEYRKRGIEAYGCDIDSHWSNISEDLNKDLFSIIQKNPYVLPYPDASFDVIVSDQVLEHVQDHTIVFQELARVLKPNGIMIHIFPTRLSLLERHTYIPLGGIFRSKKYLQFWAYLGIRNSFQRNLSAQEVSDTNFFYLKNFTNYPSRRIILKTAQKYFTPVSWEEDRLMRTQTSFTSRFIRILPFGSKLYGVFRMNVLVCGKVSYS